MDTQIYATTRSSTGTQASAQTGAQPNAHQALAGGAMFAGSPGLNFMDLIFARIAEGRDLKNDAGGLGSLSTTIQGDPAFPKDCMTNFLNQILSAQKGLNTAIPGSPEESIFAELSQLRLQLNTLLQGNPAQAASLTNTDSSADASLIATGLTPEMMTDFMSQVKTGPATNQIDAVKIVPAGSGHNLKLEQALVAIQNQAQNGDLADTQDMDALATTLNNLVVGGQAPARTAVQISLSKGTPAAVPLLTMPGGISSEDSGLSLRALDRLEEIQQNFAANGKKIPSGLEKAIDKIKSNIGAALSTITGTGTPANSIDTLSQWQDMFPENMDLLGTGAQIKGTGLSTTAAMTSLTGHAPQAIYPHPATQAVAASLSKAAAHGEDKAFTLKLDPPELGRVEVRMSIDKNHKVTAHLIIEKPETFMMLQRDAHVLERSLQGIGMEASDSGLSFELAQDGNMFRNEGEHGGEGYSAGRNDNSAHDEDITIESHMTWHTDPETGIQHYNILA